MKYRLDYAKFQPTSREEILKNFINKFRQRVKVLQKKGIPNSEEEMIRGLYGRISRPIRPSICR